MEAMDQMSFDVYFIELSTSCLIIIDDDGKFLFD